jgi:1-acyl-sn-glycerol-3-phosphate acyltransferase
MVPGVETTRLTRVIRCVRILAVVLRLYLIARIIAPRRSAAARSHLIQPCARRLLGAVGIDVRARGHIPAPGTPLLLVANHISWLDTYALNTVSAARFVAKSEVHGWPIVGTIAARFGTFFLERGRYRAAARTVAALADTLRAAQPVAAFPEGTTSYGECVRHFYPAMFQAAVLSGARVQPVAIRYRGADGAATEAAAYVGDMSLFESLRMLLRQQRLIADLVFCAPLDAAGRSRKDLAIEARAAIVTALGFTADAARPSPQRRAA